MAHFAKVNVDNTVIDVVALDDSLESTGVAFLNEHFSHNGTWVQTSINTHGGVHLKGKSPLRKNYAIIGGVYDAERDAFYAPKPFPSWILDEDTCYWNAPVAMPEDDKKYRWNESTVSWEEIA